MKVLLQGTGAADGIPALFGKSRVDQFARKHGGKDIRTRSSALIDDHLKIDFGPDTFSQTARLSASASEWSAILFTHSHDDHFSRNELQYMFYPFTPEVAPGPTIYGNHVVVSKIWERFPDWPYEVHQVCSFHGFTHAGYDIMPIEANHIPDEQSLNYLITREGKTLCYATDTGYWPDETWEFLAGRHMDALVIEATEGRVRTAYSGHMDVKECVASVERLREMGVLATGAQVVTTHHAALGDMTHAELEAELAKFGIKPGFDGLQFEV